jgi:O-antigen/teichoic acid export membrane protein
LSQKPKTELKLTLPKKIFKFFLVIIPVVILYIIIAPFLYKILFPEYLDSILYSQILALTILYIPATLLGTSLVAKMQTKKLYFLRTFLSLARIALLLILTPLYGLWGIISATLILTITSFCLNFFFFKKM